MLTCPSFADKYRIAGSGIREGVKPVVFSGVPEVCLSEQVLKSYAGEYEVESAEVTFTVSHRGEGWW